MLSIITSTIGLLHPYHSPFTASCWQPEVYAVFTTVGIASGYRKSLLHGCSLRKNDHSGQFAWIPFECKESFSCVLCTCKNDNRATLTDFIDILKKLCREAVAFPL
ncbi:MAG: hypothetical protein U0K87_03140 [Ruminococcus sp.]|nr:hypothetical protein [Ruminococcus sp.]